MLNNVAVDPYKHRPIPGLFLINTMKIEDNMAEWQSEYRLLQINITISLTSGMAELSAFDSCIHITV